MLQVRPTTAPCPRRSERRHALRYVHQVEGVCRPAVSLQTADSWPVRTWDFSTGGISLLTCRRFEPATLLAVSLAGTGDEASYLPLARVCRLKPLGSHWLIGCAWATALPRDELWHLLGREGLLRAGCQAAAWLGTARH